MNVYRNGTITLLLIMRWCIFSVMFGPFNQVSECIEEFLTLIVVLTLNGLAGHVRDSVEIRTALSRMKSVHHVHILRGLGWATSLTAFQISSCGIEITRSCEGRSRIYRTSMNLTTFRYIFSWLAFDSLNVTFRFVHYDSVRSCL